MSDPFLNEREHLENVRGQKNQRFRAFRNNGWQQRSLWLKAQLYRDRIADVLKVEADFGRTSLWCPVIFLLGAALYFALPREPSLWALLCAAIVVTIVAAIRMRRGFTANIPIVLSLLLCGMLVAKVETDQHLSPRIGQAMTAEIIGEIEAVEPTQRKRVRLTVTPRSIAGLTSSQLPKRIRVSVLDPDHKLQAGNLVSFLARLQPPSGPVLPGGYDFSFNSYFDGRGAGGFAVSKVQVLAPTVLRSSLSGAMRDAIARARSSVGVRITESLPGTSGTIARALIVGERRAIPEPIVENLRVAGLAHILAISGLHMVLLTGTMFALARGILALSSTLALTYPIKKWAAIAAFAVGFMYLLLSGASVATERAFIMVGIALFAILVDRAALTLRSLAVAAFVVATLFPHTIMGPSFQMSFLAVAGLIAMAEWFAARKPEVHNYSGSRLWRVLRKARTYTIGLAMTSLIAGAATAPLAAYHFNTIAPLSILGNLAAMPIVGFIIMPVGFFACLLMPFGLEPLAFSIMGYGIDLVVGIADFVSRLSGGAEQVGRISVLTPLVCTLGILWAAIWRSRWRWAGLGLFALGVAAAPLAVTPDIIITETGTALLVKPKNAPISLKRERGSAFEAKILLRAYADHRTSRDNSLANGFVCDPDGCTYEIMGYRKGLEADNTTEREDPVATIALARTRRAFVMDCHRADIIISRFEAPEYCPNPAHIFDIKRLKQTGAVAMRLSETGDLSVRTARPKNPRPWHAPNSYLKQRQN